MLVLKHCKLLFMPAQYSQKEREKENKQIYTVICLTFNNNQFNKVLACRKLLKFYTAYWKYMLCDGYLINVFYKLLTNCLCKHEDCIFQMVGKKALIQVLLLHETWVKIHLSSHSWKHPGKAVVFPLFIYLLLRKEKSPPF